MSEPLTLQHPVFDTADQTLYLPMATFVTELRTAVQRGVLGNAFVPSTSVPAMWKAPPYFSGTIHVQDGHRVLKGRGLACSSWGGAFASITVRRERFIGPARRYPSSRGWINASGTGHPLARETASQIINLLEAARGAAGPPPAWARLFEELWSRLSSVAPPPGGSSPVPADWADKRLDAVVAELNRLILKADFRPWIDLAVAAPHLSAYTGALHELGRSAAFNRILLEDIFPSAPSPLPLPYEDCGLVTAENPVSFRQLTNAIASLILPPKGSFVPLQGLILVTGSTSSGKSHVARGIAAIYIARYAVHRPRKRRPHLVTLEDPIEKPFATDIEAAQRLGVDYTPRQVGIDTPTYAQGLLDALRQSPALVYVGEVRDMRLWRGLIDFAGSGHLVIATAHAGSLVEAMTRILAAAGARQPTERGQVAQRLAAVIHLQTLSCDRPKQTVVVPSVWRQTPVSVARLVADGLASILPDRGDHGRGSVGRRYFAEQLVEAAAGRRALPTDREMMIARRALSWDLEGV